MPGSDKCILEHNIPSLSLKQLFSIGINFVPQETFGKVWKHFFVVITWICVCATGA
jgi:hypothetical protein